MRPEAQRSLCVMSVLLPTCRPLSSHNGASMTAMTLPVLLLVEDEGLILAVVEETLRDAGFDAITAFDAQSALNEIEQDCSRFSGLVTDIDLGNGPSGWEIARRARQLSPVLPVVYMSGASHTDWAAQGVPRSIMLAKPFAPAQLVTAIATLLNEIGGSPDTADV